MPEKVPNRPEQEAVERLQKLLTQSKRQSTVQFPLAFARDQNGSPPTPPLADLVRHGIALKVYLTLAMAATRHPYDTKKSSKDLAAALGLPNPQTSGARRVSAAISHLEAIKLVRVDRRPGLTPVVRVLHASGNGQEQDASPKEEVWITLPIDLWRHGWLIALEPRAIAVLIILREATYGRRGNRGWIDGIRKRQYGLSDDTWTRATAELVNAGLLEVTTELHSAQGEERRRNVYRLHLGLLGSRTPGTIPTVC